MYAAIVFLPIIGSAIAGLFGRVIGARASELVTTGLLFVSAALSLFAFYDVASAAIPHIDRARRPGSFPAISPPTGRSASTASPP